MIKSTLTLEVILLLIGLILLFNVGPIWVLAPLLFHILLCEPREPGNWKETT